MTQTRMARLLAFSDAEFGLNRTATPVRPRFKARKVNLTALDTDWDRRRGAAARMMAIVLRDDSESLLAKMEADPVKAESFSDAAAWLRKEATLLRKTAGRMDLAVARLTAVIARRQELASAHPAESQASTKQIS